MSVTLDLKGPGIAGFALGMIIAWALAQILTSPNVPEDLKLPIFVSLTASIFATIIGIIFIEWIHRPIYENNASCTSQVDQS